MDVHFLLSIFHIFLVVPFLGYIFLQRAATPNWLYNLLFFIGIFVVLYHLFKGIMKISSNLHETFVKHRYQSVCMDHTM